MKILNKLSLTARYMLLCVAALFVVFAVLGMGINLLIYRFEGPGQFLLGLLLGCIVTSVRISIMDVSINKSVDMQDKKATIHHQLMFFLRYGVLIAFAVVLVVFNKYFGVFGGVAGILAMQLSAYGANFLLTRKEKKDKALLGEKQQLAPIEPPNVPDLPEDPDQ